MRVTRFLKMGCFPARRSLGLKKNLSNPLGRMNASYMDCVCRPSESVEHQEKSWQAQGGRSEALGPCLALSVPGGARHKLRVSYLQLLINNRLVKTKWGHIVVMAESRSLFAYLLRNFH